MACVGVRLGRAVEKAERARIKVVVVYMIVRGPIRRIDNLETGFG